MNTSNAEHPARKKAIEILKYLEAKTTLDTEGLMYYELEDAITKIIAEK